MTGAGSDRGLSRRRGASFAGAGFSAATRGGSAGFVVARVRGSLGVFLPRRGRVEEPVWRVSAPKAVVLRAVVA